MKKGKIFKTLAVFGACLSAPLMLTGCKSDNNDDLRFRVQDGYIQYTKDGKTWQNIASAEDFKGQDGIDGEDGRDGIGIKSITIDEANSDETKTTYIITFDDNTTYSYEVKNGNDALVRENCTVTFDYNLGSFLSNYSEHYKTNSKTVKEGEWVNLPNVEEEFEELNKYFKGWYTGDTIYDEKFTNYTPVNSNITLKAMWDEELLEKDLYYTEGMEFDINYQKDIPDYDVWYKGEETEISVPRLYCFENKVFAKVTQLGDGSSVNKFSLNIEKLLLTSENYIHTICFNAFSGSNLTEINGNLDNLQSVNHYAFSGTPFLENGIKQSENNIFIKWGFVIDGKQTTLSEVNLTNIKGFASKCFEGNQNITKVTVSGNKYNLIYNIGEYSFRNCKNLQLFKSDIVVKEISRWSFENCTSLQLFDSDFYSFPESASFRNTNVRTFVVSDELSIDNTGLFNQIDDAPFYNENSLVGITLFVKSNCFINSYLTENNIKYLNIIFLGIDQLVIDTSLEIPEDSILNDTTYFNKLQDNVYKWVYQAE